MDSLCYHTILREATMSFGRTPRLVWFFFLGSTFVVWYQLGQYAIPLTGCLSPEWTSSSANAVLGLTPDNTENNTMRSKELKDTSEDETFELAQPSAVDKLFYEDVRYLCDKVDDAPLMRADEGINSTHIVQDCFTALEQTLHHPAVRRISQHGCKEGGFTLFHTVWVGPIWDAVRLGLMSTVYSHPQGCVQLNMWTTTEENRSNISETLKPYFSAFSLKVHVLNGTSLLNDLEETLPSLQPLIQQKRDVFVDLTSMKGRLLPGFSDGMRFLLLAAYGGVYVDADVLVLRSFQPLVDNGRTSRDFYYRWSTQMYGNTAILYMKKGSANARLIVGMALNETYGGLGLSRFAAVLHPHRIKRCNDLLGGNMEMLPSAYFDPSWAVHDIGSPAMSWTASQFGLHNHLEFFKYPISGARTLQHPKDFFPGAFTYHWHNRYDHKIVPHSVAWVFLRHFEAMAALETNSTEAV